MEEQPQEINTGQETTQTVSFDEFQKIDKYAIPAWRVGGGFGSLIWWLLPFGISLYGMGRDFPEWIPFALAVVVLINSISQSTFLPYIRWKHWSYRITDDEIELRRGIFIKVNTLIPINRVQHVDTRQGPLYRSYDLASVTISSAATTHEIPALSEDIADLVREKISILARKARQDV